MKIEISDHSGTVRVMTTQPATAAPLSEDELFIGKYLQWFLEESAEHPAVFQQYLAVLKDGVATAQALTAPQAGAAPDGE